MNLIKNFDLVVFEMYFIDINCKVMDNNVIYVRFDIFLNDCGMIWDGLNFDYIEFFNVVKWSLKFVGNEL